MKKKFSVHAAREIEQIGKDFVVKAWEDMGEVELDEELNDTESAFDAVKDNGWVEDGVKSEDIEIAADDDHNLYIDEAETGIPIIELRIVVESKTKVVAYSVSGQLDWEEKDGKLIMTPDAELIEEAKELKRKENEEDWKEIADDDFLIQASERELTNGWSTVDPHAVGALTDSLLFSNNLKYDDSKDEAYADDETVVYWDGNYAVNDYIQMIADGKPIVFWDENYKGKAKVESALKVAAELLKVKANEDRYSEKEFMEYLDEVGIPEDDKESEGGLIPDNASYSSWLKQNQPTTFNVAYQEWVDNEKYKAEKVGAKAKTNKEGDMKGTLKDIKAKANGKPEDKNIKVKAAAGPLTILNEMKAKLAKLDDAVSKEHFLSTNKRGVFSAPGFDYIMGGKASDAIVDAWSDYANGKIKDEEVIEKVKTNIDAAIAEISKKYGDKTVEQIRNRTEAKLKVKADELLTDRFGTPEVGSAPANDEDEIIPQGQEPEAKPAETPAGEPKPETAPAAAEAPEGGDVKVEIPGEKGMATIVNLQKALNEAQKQKEISAEVIQQLNKIMKDAGLSTQGMRKYIDAVAPMAVKAMKVTAKAKEDAGKTIISAETYYNSHIANFEVSDLCGEKTKARAKELKAVIATRLEQATDGVESVLTGKSTNEGMAITASLDVVAKAMKEWQAFEESHGEYAESMRKVDASINAMQELQDNNALKPDNFANQFKDWFGYTDKERMSIKAYAINSAQATSGLSAAKIPISMETPVETMQKVRNQVLANKNVDLSQMTIELERKEGRIPCEPQHEVTEV